MLKKKKKLARKEKEEKNKCHEENSSTKQRNETERNGSVIGSTIACYDKLTQGRMAWSSRMGERRMATRKVPLRLLDELASRVSVGILNENLSNKYWRWCGSRCSFLLVCRLTDLGYQRAACTLYYNRSLRAPASMRIRHVARYASNLDCKRIKRHSFSFKFLLRLETTGSIPSLPLSFNFHVSSISFIFYSRSKIFIRLGLQFFYDCQRMNKFVRVFSFFFLSFFSLLSQIPPSLIMRGEIEIRGEKEEEGERKERI